MFGRVLASVSLSSAVILISISCAARLTRVIVLALSWSTFGPRQISDQLALRGFLVSVLAFALAACSETPESGDHASGAPGHLRSWRSSRSSSRIRRYATFT
jgi:hypothetical protein